MTRDMDPGLIVFSGKLLEGVSIDDAEAAINKEIENFIEDPITQREIEKVINKTEARICYSEINYQGKATNMAFFEFMGDLALINDEAQRYRDITLDKLKEHARALFNPNNCSTLHYLKR